MDFEVTPAAYVEYLKTVARTIEDNKDYITSLDAATGDGDHWTNIHAGFDALLQNANELACAPLNDMFKKIGMLMMSKVGGSSGILYGSAFLQAAAAVGRDAVLNKQNLYSVLDAMCQGIVKRGKAQPGYKTMIDAIDPAVRVYKQGLDENWPLPRLLTKVREAARAGALATADMEAVKGRASYMLNKGVGHIDAGAMTMSYIVGDLMDCVARSYGIQ